MSKSETKSDRILKIEAMLLAHPRGLTQSEIARKLGVNRSTIHRYLPDLSTHLAIYEEDGKLYIDRAAYLVNIRFNLHEAMAIHLATRLLASRFDRQNPHAASALRKLGISLENLSHIIGQHLKNSADLMDTSAKMADPRYLQILEKLTLAWAEQRKVKVWHRHVETNLVHTYKFSPYFIEPYAVGQSMHVIGLRQPPSKIRTFKVERIERIEFMQEYYQIPEDFDPMVLFERAWGIWFSDGEPTLVKLQFSSSVTKRVKETIWHPTQKTANQPDGTLIWEAEVDEIREMVPWIRGWGKDVMVLEPPELRAAIAHEVYTLAQQYFGENSMTYSHVYLPIAKYDKKNLRHHPLIYHLIEVSAVTKAMWQEGLSPKSRDYFSKAVGLTQEETGRLLSFWIGLHDIGKAGPGFQNRYNPTKQKLLQSRYSFNSVVEKPHGIISAFALETILMQKSGLDASHAKQVSSVVGGHHGIWPTPGDLSVSNLGPQHTGDKPWQALREQLGAALFDLIAPPNPKQFPTEHFALNTFLALLAGFTSVADWVGSMEEYFPFRGYPMPFDEYQAQAEKQAQKALVDLGWTTWHPDGSLKKFTDLFGFEKPRPLQMDFVNHIKETSPPAMLILEAPTGIGKTEAAMYAAHKWSQETLGQGIYIAMPTMATSNQMFDRFRQYLETWYPDELINLVLAHGQSGLSERMEELRLSAVGDAAEDHVAALSWFQDNKKRRLLAPFGVGTVDQALMSVLQTKHFFVRLFGLGHKVVIFDEVHAYDTYMSALFHRLLGWLHAVGTSVIILSATLPLITRQEMVKAYSGHILEPTDQAPYPCLTIASDQDVREVALTPPTERQIDLEWLDSDDEIAAYLENNLAGGGCAAVICNTVAAAQQVYRTLQQAGLVDPDNLILFHARFPLAWRDEIEKRVMEKFSKGGCRPEKAIVVATQVIEQSLDLDFDLMVSQLAPVDLLLQRAGRVHRHEKNLRPVNLSAPRLAIVGPQEDGGKLDFGLSQYVYAPYILYKTYQVLKDRPMITVIAETVALIETVYAGAETPEEIPWIEEERQKLVKERGADQRQAHSRLVAAPSDEDLLLMPMMGLQEDNLEIHQAFQAMTRLIDPGVSLICLFRLEETVSLDPEGMNTVDLESIPVGRKLRGLLLNVVSVHNKSILKHLLTHPNHALPPAWQAKGALKHFRLAIFEKEVCDLRDTKYELRLNKDTGIRLQTKED